MVQGRYWSLLTFCLFASLRMQAQFMDYGSDPARFRWNIVKLPHYDLVYPQGNDSMAYRYALYLENAYPHVQKTIGKPMKAKFPVVLHPGNMVSNGMVSWAPRRMELLTTPSSDLGMQPWDKHLVLHESRHIFQTGKVMSGLFKPLYYLIGEQAAGVASFFLPTWFLEGDAVSTETALSNGGRGRLPEFNMVYRAQLLGSDKVYSFDKWQLGSYKDYTGTYYALGYNMTSYARQRYGADIWDKTTSRYTHNLLFAGSFKRFTGSGISQLYNDTFDYLKKEWTKLDSAAVSPTYLSPDTKNYTSYQHLQILNDSTLIAIKSSLKEINSLVTVRNGKEQRLSYIGNINSGLNLSNGCIYWTEYTPGMRWTHENYSVLKRYDMTNGRITTLTPRQRYLAPAINDKGSVVAVSRPQVNGVNELVLLKLMNGREIASFRVPNNGFIKELTFAQGDTVIAVVVDDNGISLLELKTGNGAWRKLLSTASANITSPMWNNGKLYFESGANGTNNIYCLNLADSRVYRVTQARFGAFEPTFSLTGNRLLYADYQAKGYRIASLEGEQLLHEETDLDNPTPTPFVHTLAAQEGYNLDKAQLDSVPFDPKPYHKGLHTFKVHSWAPFYYNVADAIRGDADDLMTLVKPGAMILSQNTLNTATMQAGWYYSKGHHHGKLAFTYQGWFPVLDLSVDYGAKAVDVSWVKNDKDKEVPKGHYTDRNLLEAEARIYLPFNLTRNDRIRGIQPALTYSFTNNRYQQIASRTHRNFQYLLPELRVYNYQRMAHRDLLPRSGYQLRLQYLNSPFNTENFGSLYAARLTTYWPGFIRNQGLMVRLGYQYQALDGKALYLPTQLLEATRGYGYLYQTHQQWAVKGDYAFSICSPDVNLGALIYIRRLRANLFYDYTQNQAGKQGGWTNQSSAGIDLTFDWNVLRMSYPLTTGVRLTQPIDYGNFQAEMLFSVSF
ncbi:MAG: hypothetical protein KBE85_06035 [Bacteroides sp.]|nr:hypothetical protein [Bacteroides sp.]